MDPCETYGLPGKGGCAGNPRGVSPYPDPPIFSPLPLGIADLGPSSAKPVAKLELHSFWKHIPWGWGTINFVQDRGWECYFRPRGGFSKHSRMGTLFISHDFLFAPRRTAWLLASFASVFFGGGVIFSGEAVPRAARLQMFKLKDRSKLCWQALVGKEIETQVFFFFKKKEEINLMDWKDAVIIRRLGF